MYLLCTICFLLLTTGLFLLFRIRADDLFSRFSRRKKITLRDKIMVILGAPPKGFYARDYELEQLLRVTGRAEKYALLKRLSVILFLAGAALAVVLNNIYLIPVLGLGFSLFPIWYLRSTAAGYKKHLNEQLETAISVITTSYLRTEDLIAAVKENLPYLKEPVQSYFSRFLYEVELVDASIVSAINSLKLQIPNRVFTEWCDALIQCQSDRTMKYILPPILQKFSDVRIVQAELETMLDGPKREAVTMIVLVVANIPLLYFLNKDWFHTLLYSNPGKITLAICAAIILFAVSKIQKLSRPVEYES